MKINYNEVFKERINEISNLNDKPSLFLHACCGPCLTYPLSILVKYFKVTVGYINPNIYPESEYDLRFNELKRFVDEYSKDENVNINVVSFKYNYNDYLCAVKGYEDNIEGGERCTICHRLRLSLAYDYAEENKFDYFATVMTVSSKKPSNLLNEIAIDLSKDKKTKYLPSDFKKENGNLKGIQIAKHYNLYRQCYCGCSFSYEEMQKRIKKQ